MGAAQLERHLLKDERRKITAIGKLDDARAARRARLDNPPGTFDVVIVKNGNQSGLDDCVQNFKPRITSHQDLLSWGSYALTFSEQKLKTAPDLKQGWCGLGRRLPSHAGGAQSAWADR